MSESVRNTETQAWDGTDLEDSHLEALLRYSGSFYGAAIDHGMKASDTVATMQHIEQAARGMHRVCKNLRKERPRSSSAIISIISGSVMEWRSNLSQALSAYDAHLKQSSDPELRKLSADGHDYDCHQQRCAARHVCNYCTCAARNG